MAANPVFIDPAQHWRRYIEKYLQPAIQLADEARIAEYQRAFERWRLNYEAGYKHTPKPDPVRKIVLDFDDHKAEYRMSEEILFEIPYDAPATAAGKVVIGDPWPGYTPERRFCGQGDDSPDGATGVLDGKTWVKKSFRSAFTYEYYEAV